MVIEALRVLEGALLTVVVLFLAGGDDEFRPVWRSWQLDGKGPGLFAPGSDRRKRLRVSELRYWDVSLAGLRIHRPDDDRFTFAGANPEKDSADLSWGGSRWSGRHSEFAVRLHVIQRVYGAISVFQ